MSIKKKIATLIAIAIIALMAFAIFINAI